MGEIPDRHVFYSQGMQKELEPYLSITQAVRQGDLGGFGKVVAQHAQRYQSDHTYTLISRLAHQVVKAGLRNLHLSYSRLSLQDVADRLGLPSAASAELVVAKAVRDGVLDATIHHEEGYVQSHDLVDVYATSEPSEALHRRIAYCLTTHNDAVKGMRYPPDAYKKQLEASRGLRRRGRDDEKEEDEDDLDDDDLDDY
jgi:26S proteasome regulatory subunit N3